MCVCIDVSNIYYVLCFRFVCRHLVCPVLPVSLDCPFLTTLRYPLTFMFNTYHCVDTSASGLLVLQGDIRPVVSASVELTWFITEIPK